MSGGCSALEMISRIKNNRRLAKDKREFFNKDIMESHKGSRYGELVDKKISKEELREVKKQINSRFHKERRKEIIIGIVVMVLLVVGACIAICSME